MDERLEKKILQWAESKGDKKGVYELKQNFCGDLVEINNSKTPIIAPACRIIVTIE